MLQYMFKQFWSVILKMQGISEPSKIPDGDSAHLILWLQRWRKGERIPNGVSGKEVKQAGTELCQAQVKLS